MIKIIIWAKWHRLSAEWADLKQLTLIKRLIFFPFDKKDNLGKIVSQNEKSKFQVEKIASSESWPKSEIFHTKKSKYWLEGI